MLPFLQLYRIPSSLCIANIKRLNLFDKMINKNYHTIGRSPTWPLTFLSKRLKKSVFFSLWTKYREIWFNSKTWLFSFGSAPKRIERAIYKVEQELFTLPEHLGSHAGFSGVRVTQSLVLYACFVDRCLSFCTFSFGHYVVCPSSIYGFWLSLWYLQALLMHVFISIIK